MPAMFRSPGASTGSVGNSFGPASMRARLARASPAAALSAGSVASRAAVFRRESARKPCIAPSIAVLAYTFARGKRARSGTLPLTWSRCQWLLTIAATGSRQVSAAAMMRPVNACSWRPVSNTTSPSGARMRMLLPSGWPSPCSGS